MSTRARLMCLNEYSLICHASRLRTNPHDACRHHPMALSGPSCHDLGTHHALPWKGDQERKPQEPRVQPFREPPLLLAPFLICKTHLCRQCWRPLIHHLLEIAETWSGLDLFQPPMVLATRHCRWMDPRGSVRMSDLVISSSRKSHSLKGPVMVQEELSPPKTAIARREIPFRG